MRMWAALRRMPRQAPGRCIMNKEASFPASASSSLPVWIAKHAIVLVPQGELSVMLVEARDLPVWGFPWTSNPYCRVTLGSQAERSRRDDDTSHPGRHRAPVWNQEFQFLVRHIGWDRDFAIVALG